MDSATCHLVGGAGGRVGPDLTAVGAYTTPAAILESLLEPSNKIKQGYDTVLVLSKNGMIVSGTLQRRSDKATLLRDATVADLLYKESASCISSPTPANPRNP